MNLLPFDRLACYVQDEYFSFASLSSTCHYLDEESKRDLDEIVVDSGGDEFTLARIFQPHHCEAPGRELTSQQEDMLSQHTEI